MSFDIDCRDAVSTTAVHMRNESDLPARTLYETILTSLGRDSELRRDYVRRRWQGHRWYARRTRWREVDLKLPRVAKMRHVVTPDGSA